MGGGFGHGARALGLARALTAEGCSCAVLGPARLQPLAQWAEVPLFSPPATVADRESLRSWVTAFEADLLVVDVFPRGVLGELPPARRQVLVTRHVDPAFYAAPGPASALSRFALVLATEPPAPALAGHPGLVRVPPITLRSPEPWDGGRRVLSLRDGAGFPPPYASAGVVVAGAGYGSYYEIVEAGVPAVLVPVDRKVDDQRLRASGALGVGPRAEVRVASPEEVPSALESLRGAERVEERSLGGAAEAAALILRALRGASGSPGGTCRTGGRSGAGAAP